MKIRSVLLGTAALLVTGVAANAADAPHSKVDAICEFGDSYFSIGGGNCLDISGRARFEYVLSRRSTDVTAGTPATITAQTDLDEEVSLNGLSANGRIDFTVLSATDHGPLKAFLRFQQGSAALERSDTGQISGVSNANNLPKAYLSWNGITAGRTSSFFGFSKGLGADEASHATGAWDSDVPLIAYTFDAGNGITATVSAERREAAAVEHGTGDTSTNGGVNDASSTTDVGGLTAIPIVEVLRLPDFVADVEVTQDWGSAGISAALTSVRVEDPNTTNRTNGPRTLDEVGYAIGAGVQVLVPGVDGLTLTARGTFSEGAANYIGATKSAYLVGAGNTAGGAQLDPTSDTNSLVLLKGWDIGIGASMDISDTLSANLAVSFTQVDSDDETRLFANHDEIFGPFNDRELFASATLYWTPVSDLTVGLEAFYDKDFFKQYADGVVTSEPTNQTVGGSLTITRSF